MRCDESPPQDGARHVFLSLHIKLGSYQAPPTLSFFVLEYFMLGHLRCTRYFFTHLSIYLLRGTPNHQEKGKGYFILLKDAW